MLLDQVGEVLQDLAPLPGVHSRPRTMIKSRTCRRNRGVGISRLRPGELDQRRAVPRGGHGPSRAVDRCTAFAANEDALGNVGSSGHLPPISGCNRV